MKAVPDTSNTDLARSGSAIPALAIFEGGGAKGTAHVGALKAAEELGIKFEGYAGTSAGSIVAALAAVGFTADELLNCAEHNHALKAFCDVGPLDLFGSSHWRAFRCFHTTIEFSSKICYPKVIRLPRAEGAGRRCLRTIIRIVNAGSLAVRTVLKNPSFCGPLAVIYFGSVAPLNSVAGLTLPMRGDISMR